MDQKQFERLQTAVQWVVDEDRWYREGHEPEDRLNAVEHYQGYWAYGSTTSEVYEISNGVTDRNFRVVCASGCCVAGNVVVANGDKLVVGASETPSGTKAVETSFCTDAEGKNLYQIPERAAELMGLTEFESGMLFDGDNLAEDIVEIATQIAERHGYKLEVIS